MKNDFHGATSHRYAGILGRFVRYPGTERVKPVLHAPICMIQLV